MYSQVNLEERILNQVTTQIGNNGEFLNSSNLSLELNEKQAYDIAIDILKIKYGRKQLRKQKPHNKINIINIGSFMVHYQLPKKEEYSL